MKKQIWLFITLLPCYLCGQGIPLYQLEDATGNPLEQVIIGATDSVGGQWVHKDSLGLQIDSVVVNLDTIIIHQRNNTFKIPNAIIYDYYIANNTGDFELRLTLNGIVDGGPIQYLPSPPSTHQDGRSVLHMSTSPPAGITPSNYFEVSPNRFLYWKNQVHTGLNINGEFPYSDNVILFEITDPSSPSVTQYKRIQLDETLKADWNVFSEDTFFLRVDTNVIATQNDLSNINVNTDTALIRTIVSDSVIWSTNVDGDAYINEAVGIFNTDPFYPLQVGKNPALSAGSSIAIIGDGANGMVIKESTASNPYSAAFFGPVKFWNGSEGGGALINANDDAGTAGQVLTSQGEASTFTWETIDTNTVVGLGDFVVNNSSSLWTESGLNIYRSSGNVGIGTTTPSAKLDVIGDAEINGNATITDSLNVIGSVRVHSSLYDVNNSKGSDGQIALNTEIPGSSDGFIWEDQDQALVSTHYATLYDARDTLSNVGAIYRPIRFKDATTIEHGSSFTVDVANDEIDIDRTGWYEVEYNISFTSDTDAEFTVAVLDGSNNVICGLQQDYVNSSLSFGTMSSSNIANLLDTDVLSLEIKVTSGLVDIDDINATLKIRRIR